MEMVKGLGFILEYALEIIIITGHLYRVLVIICYYFRHFTVVTVLNRNLPCCRGACTPKVCEKLLGESWMQIYSFICKKPGMRLSFPDF
jgi:hypothetical protein